MAMATLDAMAAGGMYDVVGGGFHRYSVDERWLVRHFEKMLYDNAVLASAYLHAWVVTGRERYREVVEETLDYLLRDLSLPEGGLASLSVVEYVDSPSYNVMVYESEKSNVAVIWLFDGQEEESSTS